MTYHLYDQDLEKNQYLGMCSYQLTDGIQTAEVDDELSDPKWIDFFKEVSYKLLRM